jgi:hypothetical protein
LPFSNFHEEEEEEEEEGRKRRRRRGEGGGEGRALNQLAKLNRGPGSPC